MSDFFVRISGNKQARALIQGLKLPVPLPQPLERLTTPWEAQPLLARAVILGLAPGATLALPLYQTLTETGAERWLQAPDEEAAQIAAEGHPASHTLHADNIPDALRPHALVFDATGLKSPEALQDLYRFCHTHIRALRPCGRVVVIARPPELSHDPIARATARAIDGFVRSLGREIGRKGATANTIYLGAGAENRLSPVLRFLLGKGSAYISGQPLHITTLASEAAPLYIKPLAGKVAIVTGAARGIGAATARSLAREGATVLIVDRPAEIAAAQAVANEINGDALACDITDPDAPQKILQHAQQHHGGIDILVHNAGITRDKTLANMAPDRWEQVLGINLQALIRLNECLAPTLREGGRVIALSSIGGIAGNVGQTNYAASKAGVIGYIQGIAPGLAPRGITANAIAPGFIETQMTAAIPFMTREVARRLCNLAQGGQPEDIAEAITFLASPGASGLTGSVLRVCGGNFIGA